MLLLITYVLIALGFSFICSVAEAVILSVSSAYISLMERDGKPTGKLLRDLSADINKPLSAILTLNTIAHTMGAAGAGAQAAVVFGDAYLGIISAVLTLLILVFSEIIPKTLGATYWRQLAPLTAFFLKYLIIVLYPFVKMSEKLTSGFKEESPLRGLSRGEMLAMAEISAQEGQLAVHEMNFMQSLLNLHELKIKDAMTHRTVVFSLPERMTVETYFHKHDNNEFSRIPIYEENEPEKISGFVMKSDLLLAQARGNGQKQLFEYKKDMIVMLAGMPLSSAFDKFLSQRANMILVVDEYGGLEGIITMEDLLETLLGIDIVDENDRTVSMKKLAKSLGKKREKSVLSKIQEKQKNDKS
ncbi:CNNM domain-containing protein [Planctobacterium marinum]|uniref:CNNM domain-containing protein n=1 Tax=Planctobacterium marinum TaxID=1631968 RepID=UPI001E30EF8D|nr:CNNM domain-containing protein [Planctobacterium marinum]MCC2606390.1 CNNM domain-containing protein [Planctobacterium marinum]